MSNKREQRLNQVLEFLWKRTGVGTTRKEIGIKVGLKSNSYVGELLDELIRRGKASKQIDFSGKRMRYFAAHTSIVNTAHSVGLTPLYDPITTWTFDNDHCFLCGVVLTATNRSDEHVFPKWLQRKYNLWNQTLELQNRTTIPYKQVLIPCCENCNTNYLSRLEETIANAYNNGLDEFRKLPKLSVFQWVAKIYYGILFRELSLLRDRKDASQGFIFTEEQLQEFATLHHFLQSVRLPFVFRGFQPWSMFILRILDHPIDLAFDYHDLLSPMVFGIRMGEIGLIVVLEDSGVQEVISKHYFEEIDLLSLHRIQFDEVFANVVYGASLMNRTVKYMVSMPNNLSRPTEVVQMPLMGLSSKPILDEWEPKVYAEVLSVYMERYGMTLHDVFPSSQAIWSIIHNQNDELLQLDIDGKLVKTLSPLSGEPDEDEDTIRV